MQAVCGVVGMAATYAVQVAGEKAPRRAIEPLEVNWEPARDSRVVAAGIVSGFLDALRFCSKRWPGRGRGEAAALLSSGAGREESRRRQWSWETAQGSGAGLGKGEMADWRCRSTEKFSAGQLVGDPSAGTKRYDPMALTRDFGKACGGGG